MRQTSVSWYFQSDGAGGLGRLFLVLDIKVNAAMPWHSKATDSQAPCR